MEENTQQAIKISQKVIKDLRTSSKKILSNKFISNKQNSIPIMRSRKNLNNIYDDADENQQINRTKRISQKQMKKQNITKALDNGQPCASQNNNNIGTNKKITFEYWAQQNKQAEKQKIITNKKQVVTSKQNENAKRNSIQIQKYYKKQKQQAQEVLKQVNEIIQNNQLQSKQQSEFLNKQLFNNKQNRGPKLINKIQQKNNHKKTLSKSKIQQKDYSEMKQSVPHSVKFVNQSLEQKQEDYFDKKSNKSIQCENKTQQVNNNIESWSRKTCQTFRSTHSSCEDYLSHVFNYYCKINYAFGKGVTFDQIQQKMKIMTITNFMIFCKDFKVRDKVQRDKLVEIFKSNSTYHKHLNPEQFKVVVQQIANIIFKCLIPQKRFGKMLLFLQIHNSFAFVRKMNKLGVSFRFKNKRGVDVNIIPKYTFKLTPNNGKSEMQIQTQVKERQQLRKILKQQHTERHKGNKKNKVEELYKNAVKNKAKNNKNKSIILNKQNTTIKPPVNKKNGYYNPCQFLSQRKDNSYAQIENLKKMQSSSYSNSLLLKLGSSDRMNKQLSEYSTINSIYRQRQMKINKIISQAKNSMLQQKKQQFCTINNSDIGQTIDNNVIKIEYGTIKKQNNINFVNNFEQIKQMMVENRNQKNFTAKIVKNGNQPRASKQIILAEMKVQHQIRDINPSLLRSQIKSKKHLRASAKVDKQNQKQINDLEQMIGVFSQQEDQFLEKHFNLESAYEQNLSHIQSRIQ